MLVFIYLHVPPQGSIYYNSTDTECGVEVIADGLHEIKKDSR